MNQLKFYSSHFRCDQTWSSYHWAELRLGRRKPLNQVYLIRPHPPQDQLNLEVAGGSDKEVHLAEEALQELEWCLDQVPLDTDLGLTV